MVCHLYVLEMILMRMMRYLSEKLQVTRTCVTTTFWKMLMMLDNCKCADDVDALHPHNVDETEEATQ